jgi:GDPmannose 4,6-dehydratase
VAVGTQGVLSLGNLSALRDWGHARDYVEMQWLMLQQENPEDFVIATGEQHSVRDFVNRAGAELGMTFRWEGEGPDEHGILADTSIETLRSRIGETVVNIDPKYFRPTEVETLLGDPTKAREKLGWVPRTSFDELVKEMAAADLKDATFEKGKADMLAKF